MPRGPERTSPSPPPHARAPTRRGIAGDTARHDELVAAEARRLTADHDVLVLAQASMATVVDRMPAGQITVPVLTSPRAGTAQLAALSPREEPA